MNQVLRQPHLVLFFTHNVSLQTWSQNGSLEREIALYLRLQEKGVRISFVTYGSKQDLAFAKNLQGIAILCNRWNLPPCWYERMVPYLHARVLRSSDAIKTNQTNGAEIALKAAQIWRKPLIARCGYMWSEFVSNQYGADSMPAQQAITLEQQVFFQANKVVVTTPVMAADIARRIPDAVDRTVVIPNYVKTDVFCPRPQTQRIPNRACFVGRMEQQKNLHALLDACLGLDVELFIVGRGSQEQDLRNHADQLKLKAHFLGNLPNQQLPEILNSAAVFILPSFYEGHPKALLEAMSCGLAVIGTDVPGIREVLEHGRTGYLCGTNSSDLRTALQEVLGDPVLRQNLGENARQAVLDRYSLDRIVELEVDLLRKLAR